MILAQANIQLPKQSQVPKQSHLPKQSQLAAFFSALHLSRGYVHHPTVSAITAAARGNRASLGMPLLEGVRLCDLSAKQQEDLFGRVQKGMVLTEAEKLKAQKGPWQDLALDIEQDSKEIISLAANKRALGFRNVLTTMAQIMELRTVDTKMDGSSDTPALQANGPSLKKFVANEGDKCTIEARVVERGGKEHGWPVVNLAPLRMPGCSGRRSGY
ncbi:MAG: hypothetical protein M1839_002103 [Geoglossum umbratile]|nr:MAG: hypothetical protein M1839_002103 [Geoglossum umbratile]